MKTPQSSCLFVLIVLLLSFSNAASAQQSVDPLFEWDWVVGCVPVTVTGSGTTIQEVEDARFAAVLGVQSSCAIPTTADNMSCSCDSSMIGATCYCSGTNNAGGTWSDTDFAAATCPDGYDYNVDSELCELPPVLDLALSSVVPDDTEVLVGSSLSVSYQIDNVGTGPTSQSTTLIGNLNGVEIGSTSVGTVEVGTPQTGTITLDIPIDAEIGQQTIDFSISNPEDENVGNDENSASVEILPDTDPTPEITGAIPSEVYVGDDFPLLIQVSNLGTSPYTGSLSGTVSLSNPQLGEPLIGSFEGTGLAIEGGGSITLTANLSIGQNVDPGDYNVKAELVNVTADTDLENNIDISAGTLQVRGLADLSFASASIANDSGAMEYFPGDTFSLKFDIENSGTGVYDNSVLVRAYFDGDLINETTLGPIDAESTGSGNLAFTLPVDAMGGSQQITMTVNELQAPPDESDYSNNTTSVDVFVQIEDLTIKIREGLPETASPNQKVEVTLEIRNEGGGEFEGDVRGELVLTRPDGTTQTIPFEITDLFLEPGAFVDVTLIVDIGNTAVTGSYELNAALIEPASDGNTENNQDTSTTTVEVQQQSENTGTEEGDSEANTTGEKHGEARKRYPDRECGNSAGNPIVIRNGIKAETEIDYRGSGPFPLIWARYYSSSTSKPLGWSFSYSRHLMIVELEGSTNVILVQDNGDRFEFVDVDNNGTSASGVPGVVVRNSAGFAHLDATGGIHQYDQAGRLTSITSQTGFVQYLSYSGNLLASVSDQFGRSITVEHDSEDRLSNVITPDGRQYIYQYSSGDLIETVILPDSTPLDLSDNPRRQFLYESPYLEHGLTGVIDENGNRYSTFAYNEEGRAILSSHQNGADRVTFSYADHETSVTNSLGRTTIYRFETIAGVKRLVDIEGEPTTNCPAMNFQRTYDERGYVVREVDRNGNVSEYTYAHSNLPVDAPSYQVGLLTSRTDAVGTSVERTQTLTWHAEFRLPTSITEPGRREEYVYDDNARIIQRKEIDASSGVERTWSYTYNEQGLVLSIDGPRTDVSDLWTYAYNTEGEVVSITNALGHASNFTAHDENGMPTTIVNANGVTTNLTYDERLRLSRYQLVSQQGASSVFIDYDNNGNVVSVRLPDGQQLRYSYDAVNRLTRIENDLGEVIEFVLDAAGNRVARVTKDSAGNIVRRQTHVFDELSRLIRVMGAESQTTGFQYDNNNNVIESTDALGQRTSFAFDGLNRLMKATDALEGASDYTYDARDNLVRVVDAAGVVTEFTYDGLNNMTSEVSADRGTTTYSYDTAGNRIQSIDANGIVMSYQYDALNRLLSIDYGSAAEERVAYGYDFGVNGVGRLTSTTDSSGETSFGYDDRGNLVSDKRVIDSQSYTTSYSYDLANNLTKVVYPSGRIVSYAFDSLSRVASVTTQKNAGAKVKAVASEFDYLPYGTATRWVHGNGLVSVVDYDLDYRVADISVSGDKPVLGLGYTYNEVSKITAISDTVSDDSQSFRYDPLSRVIEASGVYGEIGYSYDAAGNRESRNIAKGKKTTSEVYRYEPGSHRLSEIEITIEKGSEVRTSTRVFSHDANGNRISDSDSHRSLALMTNARNRMNAIERDGKEVGSYSYNALGQRVMKRSVYFVDAEKKSKKSSKAKKSGKSDKSKKSYKSKKPDKKSGKKVKEHLHFHYDRLGNLIAETNKNGKVVREYVYVGYYRVAMVSGDKKNEILHLHSDHLGTTKVVTNKKQKVVWSSSQTPFGEVKLGKQKSDMPMRFPGQYADRESGYNHNYFRDYDPSTGRYLQSDPIGLVGGFNSYLYAAANPISLIDLFGLAPGDRFNTPEEAAIDAIEYIWNNPLLNPSIEHAGVIYTNADGSFSYTGPHPGTPNQSTPGNPPFGRDYYASYHTHPPGGGNTFSSDRYDQAGNLVRGDRYYADRDGTFDFLGEADDGRILKYHPNSKKNPGGRVEVLCD